MTLRKRLVVKNLLCEWKNDIVCLQETRLAGVDRQMVCSLWSCPLVCGIVPIWGWVALDTNHKMGGILIVR